MRWSGQGLHGVLGVSLALCVAIASCGPVSLGGREQEHPVLVTHHTLGEGNTGKDPLSKGAPVTSALPAGSATSAPTPGLGSAPDPAPHSQRKFWRLDILYDKGQLSVADAESVVFETPQETPRRMGRFAYELWVGGTLLERVRFGIPLLSPSPPAGGVRGKLKDPGLDKSLRTHVGILVPDLVRATHAEIVDRATQQRTPVSWPPTMDQEASPADPPQATSATVPVTGAPSSAVPQSSVQPSPAAAP